MLPFFLALYNGSQVSIVALWATCSINLEKGYGYRMGACIRKHIVYDMSCKRFQFFVNVEALAMNVFF